MADIDQGLLDYLNFAIPGCSANQAYARVLKQTGFTKSVSLGQVCPAGYNPAPNDGSDGFPINTMNKVCNRNTPPTPAERSVIGPALSSLATCATAPAPPLVCEYCKCPQGSGRIDPGCPVQSIACRDCPVAFTQGTPITPAPAPAPVLTPAPKSELPIWAIILIVIAVFGVVCGLVYAGIKMSQ